MAGAVFTGEGLQGLSRIDPMHIMDEGGKIPRMEILRQSAIRRFPSGLLGPVVAVILVLAGCSAGSRSSSSTGSGGTIINISQPTAIPSDLNEGETSVIEVTVTDGDNTPVEGVSVDFIVSPSGGGYFTPPTAITDTNGLASAVFTAQQPGTMSIAAMAEGNQSTYTSITVASTGQQTSGNLEISVNPGLLIADGASSATVSVTVRDIDDNPAPAGTVVRFAAGERFDDVDGDGYWTRNVDALISDYNSNGDWDPIGLIPGSATTDASGVASATYTAGTVATMVYIKTTVTGTADYDGTIESSVQLAPDVDVYSIELSSEATGIQVQHTGGIETTDMHATCYDINGDPVPEGQTVTFVITDGPGGGENIAGQDYGPVAALTNSSGVATVPVWSGTISGTIRIYASSGTALSNATFIVVHAGPPYYIGIRTELCNMDGWNTVNREQHISAAVADLFHNPVQNGVAVYFTVDEGIIGAYGITQDSTGVAGTVFRTGEPQVDGIVWVWGETSGGAVVGSTFFINSYIPDHIYGSIMPTVVPANGSATAAFRADVRDLNDNFVVGGTGVTTKTLFGAASGGGTVDGCHASVFKGEYGSATLDQDYSVTGIDDDGIGGIDVITLESGFADTAIVCTLTTEYAFAGESSFEMQASSIPYGATNVPFHVIVKDRYGNPLADHTMTATASAGTIAAGTESQETNTFGEAFGFRYNAPVDSTVGKSALIIVTDGDVRGGGLTLSASLTFTAKKK